MSSLVPKLSQFKKFAINFSLDAISEDTFKYVRYPGNFSKVKKNRLFYDVIVF